MSEMDDIAPKVSVLLEAEWQASAAAGASEPEASAKAEAAHDIVLAEFGRSKRSKIASIRKI